MIPLSTILPSLLLFLAPSVHASTPADLVGTWSSKSDTVVTGLDFYDPIGEKFKEPRLPGSSLSLTSDGHFEEARYIVVANPTKPRCPSAYLQWQHGEYVVNPDGSIDLQPIQVDGRQLKSDHCANDKAIYTRFNQTERLKWYEVLTDSYRGKKRLNLYKSDGSPLNPMYLRFDSPQILPTTTLNPLVTSTAGGAQQTGAGDAGKRKVKLKRELPMRKPEEINADRWWWIGVGMTAIGGVGWYCS